MHFPISDTLKSVALWPLFSYAYGFLTDQRLWTLISSWFLLQPSFREVLLCWVTKLHILEWPFIVPSTRCTFVMIMLINQLLNMPHLS